MENRRPVQTETTGAAKKDIHPFTGEKYPQAPNLEVFVFDHFNDALQYLSKIKVALLGYIDVDGVLTNFFKIPEWVTLKLYDSRISKISGYIEKHGGTYLRYLTSRQDSFNYGKPWQEKLQSTLNSGAPITRLAFRKGYEDIEKGLPEHAVITDAGKRWIERILLRITGLRLVSRKDTDQLVRGLDENTTFAALKLDIEHAIEKQPRSNKEKPIVIKILDDKAVMLDIVNNLALEFQNKNVKFIYCTINLKTQRELDLSAIMDPDALKTKKTRQRLMAGALTLAAVGSLAAVGIYLQIKRRHKAQ